jgi:hypothetical protein
MTTARLLSVVDRIVSILAGHGRDKADWLSERAKVLRTPTSQDDDVVRAREEMHGIVMGMGGLFDLALEPSSDRNMADIRHELDELPNQLHKLTA